MSDIVERLRSGELCGEDRCRVMDAEGGCTCAIAADQITRLRAENDMLREGREAGLRNFLTMQGAANALRLRAEKAEAENERLEDQAASAWVDGYDAAKDEYRQHLIEAEDEKVGEINRLLVKIRDLQAENARLREALEPLATQFLWPDDLGFEMAEDIKSDPDYDENTNDMTSEEVFILRRDVRRARAAFKKENA